MKLVLGLVLGLVASAGALVGSAYMGWIDVSGLPQRSTAQDLADLDPPLTVLRPGEEVTASTTIPVAADAHYDLEATIEYELVAP